MWINSIKKVGEVWSTLLCTAGVECITIDYNQWYYCNECVKFEFNDNNNIISLCMKIDQPISQSILNINSTKLCFLKLLLK